MEVIDDVKPMSAGLRPKQLGNDEVVVFKLCSIGKKEFGREEPTAPEVYQLAGKESIMDPFEKRDPKDKDFTPTKKTIGTYVIENKVINGVMKAYYKQPQFIKGYCTIHQDEQPMYEFLMRSKKNKSNKFKTAEGGKKVKDIFMLVEDAKEIIDQLQVEDLRWEAESIVRKGDWIRLKSMSNKLNQSPDKRLHITAYQAGVKEDDLQGMKLELIHKAKVYPKQVIAASDDPEANLLVQIHEAMNFSVLIFENGSYAVLTPKEGLKAIHTPDKDEAPIESLTKYLMSPEGKNDYVLLGSLLTKALKG